MLGDVLELYNLVAVSSCSGMASIHFGAVPGIDLVMVADSCSLLVANSGGGMTITCWGGLVGLTAGLTAAFVMGLR